MSKSKQQSTPYKSTPIVKTLSNQFTENITNSNKSNTNLFTDPLFPPKESSIYSQKKELQNYKDPEELKFLTSNQKSKLFPQYGLAKADKKKYIWKRLSEEYPSQEMNLITDNHPLIEDVIQGDLGDCYFLSALAALSEKKETINNLLIKDNDNNNIKQGKLCASIYLNGQQTNVVIDDYFPFKNKEVPNINNENGEGNNKDKDKEKDNMIEVSDLSFAGINKTHNNIWPIILEKIWAKCNLSYEDIVQGNTCEALEFLTPAPVETIYHYNIKVPYNQYSEKNSENNKNNLYEIIKMNLAKNYIILSDITNIENTKLDTISKIGLIPNHSYPIIDTYTYKPKFGDEVQLIKLRNLWGTNVWLGEWSPKSTKWTNQLKLLLNYTQEEIDKGYFWISYKDFIQFYTCTHICKINDSYKVNMIKIKANNSNENPFKIISVDVPETTNGFFIINMKSTKIYNNLKGYDNNNPYKNPFISVMILYKKKDEFVYVGSTSGRDDRLYVECEKMEKGKYYILVTFPKKNNSKFEINDTFESENLAKNNFRVYTYTPKDVNINELSDDDNVINNSNIKSIIDQIVTSIANSSDVLKHFFLAEGEAKSFRSIKFDDSKCGFGFIYYNNRSNSFIREKAVLTELDNIKIMPLKLSKGKFSNMKGGNDQNNEAEIDDIDGINIVEYDDPFTRIAMESFKKNTSLDSSIDILNNKKQPYEIQINIAPNSKCLIFLQKTDDNSNIDLDSDICFDYLPNILLNEEKFRAKKYMLRYNDNPIEVYEWVTEHNTGVFFQYKNKTRDYKVNINIKFTDVVNLFLSLLSDDVNSKDKKLMIRKNANGKFRDDTNDSVINLQIMPGETKFFEIKVIDVFQEFSYKCHIDYQFILTK